MEGAIMKYNPYVLTALVQLVNTTTSLGTSTPIEQSSKMLILINAERAKHGIQPLIMNSALCRLATMKSQDMVEKNYFSHQSPTYGSSFSLLKTHNINYSCAGENLSIDKYVDYAHAALINSKAHKDNILNPSFKEIGIGIYSKGIGSYAYTQLFIG
jgi:uncharacterized YkwD family protein